MSQINIIRIVVFIILLLAVIGMFNLASMMVNQREYDEYYLHQPEHLKSGENHPLILYLHGGGIRGVDPSELADQTIFRYAEANDSFPFMVVAPVCDDDDSWHSLYLFRFLDTIIANYPVDTNRIYLTGISMGGMAVWDMAYESPHRFAAVAPVCARHRIPGAHLEELADVPVWAFHGKKDDVIPYEQAEDAIGKIREAGGEAKLTLYPDLGHAIWDEVYLDPMLYTWFLEHQNTD